MNITPTLKISKENLLFIEGKSKKGFYSRVLKDSAEPEHSCNDADINVLEVNSKEKFSNEVLQDIGKRFFEIIKPIIEFISKLASLSFELINFSVKILSNISVVSFNLIKEFNIIKFGDQADTKNLNQQVVRESSPPTQNTTINNNTTTITNQTNVNFGSIIIFPRDAYAHYDGQRRRSYSDLSRSPQILIPQTAIKA